MLTFLRELKKKKWFFPVMLAAVIVLQMIFILFCYVNDKLQYHCDEIYSFGLSNSFFEPYLERKDVYSDADSKMEEWISGKEFHDYLAVNDGEQFRYDSVWYDQEKDRHPPLFYATLHTVCSFFPENFSFLYGFIPNLVYFVVTMIFLYLLTKRLFGSEFRALMFCLMCGFTPTIVTNTLFIRMYCPLVMWTIILYYLHTVLIQSDRKNALPYLIAIIFATALGILTQYLFIFPTFIIAVCFCIRYLMNKDIGRFFSYGISMLSGVAFAFAVFPTAAIHLFSEGDNAQKLRFSEQIIMSIRYIMDSTFRLPLNGVEWYLKMLAIGLIIAAVIVLPIALLFRDKTKILLRDTSESIRRRFSKEYKKEKKPLVIHYDPVRTAMFLSVIGVTLIVSYTAPFILGFIERYLFIICPFIIILVFDLVCRIFKGKKYRIFSASMIALFALFVAASCVFNRSINTLWNYQDNIDIRELYNGNNVVYVADEEDFNIPLSSFSYELCTADNVFVTNFFKEEDDLDKIASFEPEKPMYLMISVLGYYNFDTDDKGDHLTITDYVDDKPVKTVIYMDDYLEKYRNHGFNSNIEKIGRFAFVKGQFVIYRIR